MSKEQAQVRVSIPKCPGSPFTLNPGPNLPAVLDVCSAAEFSGTGLAGTDYFISVVRIDSPLRSLQVVFKAPTPADTFDDAFLVLPTDRLGNSYWSLGYRGNFQDPSPSVWAAVNPNGSTIELNYRTCSDIGATQTVPASDVFQQKCDPGTALEDGTGFQVYSTGGQPFGLISGAECAFVPPTVSQFCDTLVEMMAPASWASDDYLVTEFNKLNLPTLAGDLVRILAVNSGGAIGTVSFVAGGSSVKDNSSGHECDSDTTFALAQGEWCDVSIAGGARITTTGGNILVGQFMKGTLETGTGDPSFVLVTPIARLRCNVHRFFSFYGFPYNSTTKDGSYVNIVAATTALGSVTLDGATLASGTTCMGYSRVDFPTPPGGTAYSWTKCRLLDPPSGGRQHVLDSADSLVGAYAYGQRPQGAYSYPTGAGF